MNLAEELRAATADPPPSRIDLDQLVALEERRKVRVRWLAAGCAAAVAVTATIVGVQAVAVDHPAEDRFGQVFAPDRLPDLANLPSVTKVWPKAVHKLPSTLPDGRQYMVHEVLGGDRYLVGWGDPSQPVTGPGVFDTRAGTVTPLAPPGSIQGVTRGHVFSPMMAGDQAVWVLQGSRHNEDFFELWTARLDGTGLRRLAQLRNGVPPWFAVSGQNVLWDQELPGAAAGQAPHTSVWRVKVSGGRAAEIPGSTGWSLAYDGPWLTTQVIRGGVPAHDSGHLWNPITGQKLRWTAAHGVRSLRCGPAWCWGEGRNGGLGLQRLDGSGYVELPDNGVFASIRGGRLALGVRPAPEGDYDLPYVWDRETGRAGVQPEPEPEPGSNGDFELVRAKIASFGDPLVLTWYATDHLMVLDLAAIG